MFTTLLDIVPDLLELVIFWLSSLGLSIAGIYIEQFGLTTILSGELVLGIWACVIGAPILAFAYLIATDKLVSKLHAIKHQMNAR